MTREELTRRHADYGRWRWIAGAVGAMPLLSVYFLVHTPYLKGFLPGAKFLAVLILFFVPLGWLLAVTRLYERWGATRYGLRCPHCGEALLGQALRRAINRGSCLRCGGEVIADPAFPDAGRPGT
ncbi:MAG: hypothetical protein MUC71_00285 [Steroidobacteraceae bacterium]|jgi:hypothetical protein|nr:hypothetical protein [Steroidobacteraceae bacterium]